MDENRPRTLVSAEEESQIARTVIEWLNAYAGKPLPRVDFEFLGKSSGLTLSTIQSPFKLKQYITGGYLAQYQFQIVYRLIASNSDERLSADEALNMFGDWAEKNPPSSLPNGIIRWRTKRDTSASTMARYDNNAEDHMISLTTTYEVI